MPNIALSYIAPVSPLLEAVIEIYTEVTQPCITHAPLPGDNLTINWREQQESAAEQNYHGNNNYN